METSFKLHDEAKDLLYKIHPVLVTFPKGEQGCGGLANNIKTIIIQMITYIDRANKVKSKALYFAQEADSCLYILKTLIDLARKEKYFSADFYNKICLKINDINRLLIGYIKYVSKK
jgi:hypothetical protein